jgi:hypothetical protein
MIDPSHAISIALIVLALALLPLLRPPRAGPDGGRDADEKP